MSTTLLITLCALIIPLALRLLLKYVYLPIKIRHRNLPRIEYEYTLTSNEKLTQEQRDLIADYVNQFTTEGFEVAANLLTGLAASDATGVSVLLVNRNTGDVGQLILTSAKLHRGFAFAIRSHFAGAHDVVTSCKPNPGHLPRNPDVDSVGFGWAREVAVIAEAHRRRLDRLGLSKSARITPEPGKEMEYLQKRRALEMEHFVKTGYYYRDEQAGLLRKTWKGTFLSAWKHQQPMKTLRLRYRDRAARKIWIDLGMDDWKGRANSGSVSVEIENPPDDVNASPPSPIGYQIALAAGEVRVEWNGSAAIIRCGKPSLSAYLLMRWTTVAWITFCAFVMVTLLPQIWILYHLRMLGALPSSLRFGGFVTSLAVLLYLFIRSVLSLVSGLRRTRGTTTLTASPSGLHFENAPARPRRGSIRREELQNLIVVRRESHLFQSLHQLEASVLHRFSRQPLLVATNPAKLLEARRSIAQAMGIEKPDEATAI